MGIYDREYYQESELPRSGPWTSRSMVTILIVINVVVQVANLLLGRGDPVLQYLWLQPMHLLQPWNWYRLLTCGFAHSPDIMHILFNMLALFFLGPAVEQKYGRWEFLRIYLLSIVICSLSWALPRLIAGDSMYILLGASGAVTTIVMLFVFSFPQAILHIWGVIPVKAWVVGILIVGMNLLGSSRIHVGGQAQVAYDVHLVGAALAAIYFYARLNLSFLANWWQSGASLVSKRKPKLRIHDTGDRDGIAPRRQAEADRILEKIHREGQDSLTRRERQFLEEYSRDVRRQRQS